MSAVTFLLALLVLSYLGSGLMARRTSRGFGLPSGAQYVVLGFVLGPHVLSGVSRELLESFRPVIICGVGWLGLVVGTSFLPLRPNERQGQRLLVGVALAAAVAAVVSAVAYGLLVGSEGGGPESLPLALACGMVCAETTRQSVRWVTERYAAQGELSALAFELARASPVVTMLLLGWIEASSPAVPFVTAVGRFGMTLGMGVVLGLTAALLLGRDFRGHASWSLLLGAALLGMGAVATLGLSPIAAMLAMGLALSAASRHRGELGNLLAPTETPVLLPLLVVTGASVDAPADNRVLLVLLGAFGVKLAVRTVMGLLVSGPRAPRRAGALLGLGLTATGGASAAAALGFVRTHPETGVSVVLLAAASVVLGELLGPLCLHRALAEADELPRPAEPAARPMETAGAVESPG